PAATAFSPLSLHDALPIFEAFDAAALRAWAADLGVPTFVGTSGRVFPEDLKAAPLLRGWVRRLRAQGVQLHVHHRWSGWAHGGRSEEHTSELQSRENLVCR